MIIQSNFATFYNFHGHKENQKIKRAKDVEAGRSRTTSDPESMHIYTLGQKAVYRMSVPILSQWGLLKLPSCQIGVLTDQKYLTLNSQQGRFDVISSCQTKWAPHKNILPHLFSFNPQPIFICTMSAVEKKEKNEKVHLPLASSAYTASPQKGNLWVGGLLLK